jgi:hypothetical protein
MLQQYLDQLAEARQTGNPDKILDGAAVLGLYIEKQGDVLTQASEEVARVREATRNSFLEHIEAVGAEHIVAALSDELKAELRKALVE